MTGSHRTSLRQIRKACAAEGHHWQSWDRWLDYCTHCELRRAVDTKATRAPSPSPAAR